MVRATIKIIDIIRVHQAVIINVDNCSEDGTKAWDTFATLEATAKKLDVSFYEYIYDRVSSAYKMPSLADLISARAEHLQLGASWLSP